MPGSPIDPDPKTDDLTVVCTYDVLPGFRSTLPWELTVDPAPIEEGGQFSARFEGVALFPESFLDTAQGVFEPQGGIKEVNLLGVRATVVAYAGATGAPAVLTETPLPYQCALEDPPGTRPPCDPANNLPGGPGLVGNTDCQPESEANPCGRFFPLPTSDDCAEGGVCWNVGRDVPGSLCEDNEFCKEAAKTQCATNGFCITGALRVPMESAVQEYVAGSSDEVLFGWHEPDRGREWALLPPLFQVPIGPNALRFYVSSLPVAMECLLGMDKGDTEVGRTPDSELIAFEVPGSACADGTKVCPEGFRSTNAGTCRLSTQGEVVVLEDPQGSPPVCERPASDNKYESFLPIDDTSVLASPTLAVRATIEVKNVDDDACLAQSARIADLEFWDEDRMKLTNTLLIFNRPTEVSVSEEDPSLRSTAFWPFVDVAWSSGPDVCCKRTFQTFWEASVAQCEGW